MAAGDFAVALYRFDFADGSSRFGAGVTRVDQDGKMSEIYSMGER